MEIGTVTPRAQPGNPAPRLLLVPPDGTLINRMGFDNDGAEAAANTTIARTGLTAPADCGAALGAGEYYAP